MRPVIMDTPLGPVAVSRRSAAVVRGRIRMRQRALDIAATAIALAFLGTVMAGWLAADPRPTVPILHLAQP